MAKFPLDLSRFKKISTNGKNTILAHPSGHKFIVSHKSLKPEHLEQLHSLPFAGGGDVPSTEGQNQPKIDWDAEKRSRQKSRIDAREEAGTPQTPVTDEATPMAQGGPVSDPVEDTPDSIAQDAAQSAQTQAPVAEQAAAPQDPDDQQRSVVSQFANALQAGAPAQPPTVKTEDVTSDKQAPQGPATQPAGPSGFNSPMLNAYQDYKTAAEGVAEQEKAAYAQKAIADQDFINRQTAARQNFETGQQEKWGEIQNLQKDIEANHVNPNSYMENKSTPGKVATAVGLILGGIGGGLTHQENPALKFLNAQIDRDIDSQKSRLGEKNTILSGYMDRYKNANVAEAMARASQNAAYAAAINKAANQAGSAEAIQRGQMAAYPFAQQAAQLTQQAHMIDMAQGGHGKDPSTLVPYLVPPEHQKAVFEEIKHAQDTRGISGEILNAFARGSSRNPVTAAQGQREFEGLINTTVSEKEGTARQAAFDSIHKNMTPSGLLAAPGENAARLRTVQEYLRANSAAPVAKGFHIDLDRFPTTAPVGANTSQAPIPFKPRGQ